MSSVIIHYSSGLSSGLCHHQSSSSVSSHLVTHTTSLLITPHIPSHTTTYHTTPHNNTTQHTTPHNNTQQQQQTTTPLTANFNAFNPFTTNSNTVCKFSADGAVTNTFEYPRPKAPAMVRPNAADLPYASCHAPHRTRPRLAVTLTVFWRSFCVKISSMEYTAVAWSAVRQRAVRLRSTWLLASRADLREASFVFSSNSEFTCWR